ncbi:hypothetical protein AYL99_03808 [Fonsecaea erecta]|uniref:Uncharacterized protein n=1 Tax=Fonsecaea erecta TaxID=1367422 RepID=A0A178ZRI6_9EURO|nr:hypothetical protein AYL99_03808 [Fonsecaea erecta]OAP61605.1 hypothetical protein AYL99_03808 [Fonsecaea erecta]
MPGQWLHDSNQSFCFVEEDDIDMLVNDEDDIDVLANDEDGGYGDNPPTWLPTWIPDLPLRPGHSSCFETSDVDQMLDSWSQHAHEIVITPFHCAPTPLSESSHGTVPYDVDVSATESARRKHKLPLLAPKPVPAHAVDPRPEATVSGVAGLRPLAPKPLRPSNIHDFPSAISKSTSGKHRRPRSDAATIQLVREETCISRSLEAATVFDRAILSGLSSIHLTMGYNIGQSRSQVDMYITALRQVLRSMRSPSSVKNDGKRRASAEGVLWVVREAWPSAEGYYNMTATLRGLLAVEMWRNFPSERTYRQLPPEYRPTRAQMVAPHPPNIDWLPWPDVRDLAIRYQNSYDMDAIFRMAIHNVVAHRKPGHIASSLEDARSSGVEDNTSFRIWDLICSEKANGTEPLADSRLERKAILRSPTVKAVLDAYDLEYDQFHTQKLDDEFFLTFPCLYAESAASSWKVRALDGVPLFDVGAPVALSRPAVARLQAQINSILSTDTLD